MLRRALAALGTAAAPLVAITCLPSFAGFTDGAADAAADGLDGRTDGAAPADAPPSGVWRRTIHLRAKDALPAGYSVAIDAFGDLGHAKPDLSNVHVVGPRGEVPRVVDLPPAPKVSLWFALQSAVTSGADDTSYALVYGDDQPPLAAEAAVFVSSASFTDGAVPADWRADGVVSLANGRATLGPQLDGGSSSLRTAAPASAAGGIGVEMLVIVPAQDTSGSFWLGFQGTDTTSCPWQLFLSDVGSAFELAPSFCDVAGRGDGGAPTATTGGTHLLAIDRAPTRTRWLVDRALLLEIPSSDSTPLLVIAKTNLASSPLALLRARTRLVVDAEPVVALDPEAPR